ncbi:MAG: sigma-54-dependent Fis family transcriptional regulator [Spirochaetales bacterium]|nr:MAG: sigma-54-dependent Fis family transcriptional regulator [Spirochaetales bacterium]
MGNSKCPKILIVDDEPGILHGLSGLFKREGFTVFTGDDAPSALVHTENNSFEIAILDIRLKNGYPGTDLLKELKARDPDLPVIMITGFGSVESAVGAMKLGASDYILKPLDNSRILDVVRRNIELTRLKNDNIYLRNELRENLYSHDIVTEDPVFLSLIEMADRVKNSQAAVLLGGESGTGKEIMARYIHFTSERKDGPFVCVNCAALSESLLLSELFGHEKGSFTGAVEKRLGKFELANKGTLFLDEIGDMSIDIQAKLLRVLEESSFERVGGTRQIAVDIRVITASNKSITELITAGKFRKDLYYRINTVNLRLPSLRDRPEDIPPLADYFIRKYNLHYRKKVTGVSPEVMSVWKNYGWPGNVRELQNIINQAVLLSEGEVITGPGIETRKQETESGVEGSNPVFEFSRYGTHRDFMRAVTAFHERELIEGMLVRFAYNQSKTARAAYSLFVNAVNVFGPHPKENRIWTSMSRRARLGMSAHMRASKSSLKIMV